MVPTIEPDMKNIDSSFTEESNDYSDTKTNYFSGDNPVFASWLGCDIPCHYTLLPELSMSVPDHC